VQIQLMSLMLLKGRGFFSVLLLGQGCEYLIISSNSMGRNRVMQQAKELVL